MNTSKNQIARWALMIAASFSTALPTRSAELQASDGFSYDYFGRSLSQSAAGCVAGASGAAQMGISDVGAAYFFRNIPSGPGVFTEQVKLVSSTPGLQDDFGYNVASAGNLALVTGYSSVARLYQHLDTASGTIMENARLYDGSTPATGAVSLSGTTGLVAFRYYRNLGTASGNVQPSARLAASDGETIDQFGAAVVLDGNSALVGADEENHGTEAEGAAYYYRDLSSAAGKVFESVKLVGPLDDYRRRSYFGSAVSLAGGNALVGAPEKTVVRGTSYFEDCGEAYYFPQLAAATGVVTAGVRLQVAQPYRDKMYFATSVCLSGSNALIGTGVNRCYLFRHLDTASGIVYQDVELNSSEVNSQSYSFGGRVGLVGDIYTITDIGTHEYAGQIYTGSISAVSTLDAGNTQRTAARVSFESRVDWIIGETTDGNEVDLASGDKASLLNTERAVYIGKNAGSDGNLLFVAGRVYASFIYVGSTAGNSGNVLQVRRLASINTNAIRLAGGNQLALEGDSTAAKAFLQETPLQVWMGGTWVKVTAANYRTLIRISQSGGYTVITPVS